MTPAPFFDDVSGGAPGGASFFVTAADGVRLRVAHFALDAARNGTVLILPGRTEYIEKYAPAADELAKRGFASAVIDWRGQGLSDRLAPDPILGHVKAFSDYQLDFKALHGHVEQQGLPGPIFMVAHSMGGAIGLRALLSGFQANAVVFSAPMWEIEMSVPKRAMAWPVSSLATALGFQHIRVPSTKPGLHQNTDPFEGNTLTTDPERFAFMQHQTRTYPQLATGAPSFRWLREALNEIREIRAHASPDIPCLTALGTRERVVGAQAIVDRMGKWPNGTILTFPGCEHEVMMEGPAARTQFFDSVAGHFVAHGDGTPVKS